MLTLTSFLFKKLEFENMLMSMLIKKPELFPLKSQSSLHDVVLVGRAGPGDEGEGLLVVEDGAQPDLVVHDGLQALDALQLHPLPLPVPHAAMGKWSLNAT